MPSATLPPILIETLRRAQDFLRSRGVSCYLVGGLLRDQHLARPLRSLNVDLAVPSNALPLSRDLAAALGGAYVTLDEALGSARVIVSAEHQRIELDVSDFRGPTLEQDLALRDFTINAMAISLEAWLMNPLAPLTDPLHGLQALSERRLTPCFPRTFEEDPIRILRAFRFSSQLGFSVDHSVIPLIEKARVRLTTVSGERIRDELLAICDTDRAAEALRSLNELLVLDVLFPELIVGRGVEQGGYHHLDVLSHELEAVAQADRMLSDFAEFSQPLREPLAAHCKSELVDRHSRKALIKLGALLHDIGKPARRTVAADGDIWFLGHEQTGAELAAPITQRLRLSNRESEMVCQLVLHHLRPGFLSREPQLTRRAIYRFFKDLGEDGPACLLTWWADRMATRGPKSRLDQVDQQRARLEEMLNAYFFKAEEVVKPPRLVDGRQLMQTFQLKSCPLIGELLALIEEAQAEGKIKTADEALALARSHLGARPIP